MNNMHHSQQSPGRFSGAALRFAVLLMFVLGGSNDGNFALRGLAEIVGAMLIGVALALMRWQRFWATDYTAALIAAGLLVLIAAHLAPLPPAVWSALPGRALCAEGDRLLFGMLQRRPLSLDPQATLETALFLIPAAATWLLVRADRDGAHSRALLGAVLLFLLLTGLFGFAQAMGANDARLYLNAHGTLPTGLFANRNHQAIAMTCGLPLGVVFAAHSALVIGPARRFGWREQPARIVLGMSLSVFFALAALLTGSRAGLVLLPLASAGAAAVVGRDRLTRGGAIGAAAMLATAFLVVVAALAAGPRASGGTLGTAFYRGLSGEEDRFGYWPGVVNAAREYGFAGSGVGTFARAYQVVEPDDLLAPLYLNHAHNDWMEIAVETGLPGLLLLVAFLVWYLRRARRAWRDHGPDAALPQAATIVIGILLAHSIVDYPLRTIAISSMFAMAVALLSPTPRGERAACYPAHLGRKKTRGGEVPLMFSSLQ